MIRLSLSAIAGQLDAELEGADAQFTGVSTDTRTLQPGNLFVALNGPNFDAHAFVAQAAAKGAAAALLGQPAATSLPALLVADPRVSLASLATLWRQQFSLPVVAITGSNGKTTVKEMTSAILTQCGATLMTQGNLNNDIGLPLTLCRLSSEHRFAVIEMGANHPGEIAYLTHITRPTVALITNAGPAHLEGFGTVEGVAHAKGEIFAGLEEDGVAVINRDDALYPVWRELADAYPRLSFGLDTQADVSATWQAHDTGSELQLTTPQGAIGISLGLPGRHNVLNALAASAAALAAGADLNQIKRGLESMQPVKGRLQIRQGGPGICVIDDSYNANPASLTAALQVLAAYPGATFLALGDMAELGRDVLSLHEQAGHQAHELGIQRLFAVGDASRSAVLAFGAGASHFTSQSELIEALLAAVTAEPAPVTVLIKGSRSAQMEHVVAALAPPTLKTHSEHLAQEH